MQIKPRKKKHIVLSLKKLINKDNRSGAAYVDLIIKTLVIVVILMTAVNALSVYSEWEKINYIAKRVTRAIELNGAVDSSIYSLFDELSEKTGVINPTLSITDVGYFDPVEKTIQLRDTFTVTVTADYLFQVLQPIGSQPVPIRIPLSADLTGMSEVYHKP